MEKKLEELQKEVKPVQDPTFDEADQSRLDSELRRYRKDRSVVLAAKAAAVEEQLEALAA